MDLFVQELDFCDFVERSGPLVKNYSSLWNFIQIIKLVLARSSILSSFSLVGYSLVLAQLGISSTST
jgi:hypothetical protein